MSRIGKNPIIIPEGVTVSVDESVITVKGKLGELSQEFTEVSFKIEDSTITVERICSADLASIHGDNSSEPANAYFSGTVMTLSSTDGAVTIKCTDASKGLSRDVNVSCDQETGEIVSSPTGDLATYCE